MQRFVAQGFAFGAYARIGGPVKSEEDPLDPAPGRRCARRSPRSGTSRTRSSVREWTEGIVLRYGGFYGPGTSLAPGEEQSELVRKRKFPVVGDGGGVWSFIHIADAAEATVAAIEHGSRGVYNVVDDDPAPVAEWLPALAQTLGAKKPMRVPRFVGAAVRRGDRRGDDDRDPRRVEREGQARAGVAPGAPELAAGVRGGMTDREQTARRAAAGRLRDRLPDARQRLRGRGRGAGGAAAGAPGARRRRARSHRRARSSPP